MLNSYLTNHALSGYSAYTLLIQPYKEGYHNLKKSFSSKVFPEKNMNTKKKLADLTQRIKHIAVSIALFTPLLNTITMLFLRIFEPTGFIKDKPTVYNKIDKLLSDPRLAFDYKGNTDDMEPVISKIRKEIAPHTKSERRHIEVWALTSYLTDFIDAFTFPFIRGEKNACDESRQGLMQAIEEKIHLFDPQLSLLSVEAKAFEIYISKNVQLVDRALRENPSFAPSLQSRRDALTTALQETLPIDFPNMMSILLLLNNELSEIIDEIVNKHLEEKEIE